MGILRKIGFRQEASDFVKSHSNGVKIGVKKAGIMGSYQITDMNINAGSEQKIE